MASHTVDERSSEKVYGSEDDESRSLSPRSVEEEGEEVEENEEKDMDSSEERMVEDPDSLKGRLNRCNITGSVAMYTVGEVLEAIELLNDEVVREDEEERRRLESESSQVELSVGGNGGKGAGLSKKEKRKQKLKQKRLKKQEAKTGMSLILRCSTVIRDPYSRRDKV